MEIITINSHQIRKGQKKTHDFPLANIKLYVEKQLVMFESFSVLGLFKCPFSVGLQYLPLY